MSIRIGHHVYCRIDATISGIVVGLQDNGFIVVVRPHAGGPNVYLPAADVRFAHASHALAASK